MIVTLDTDFRSHLLLSPVRSGRGELLGVGVIAHFINPQTGVRIPTELLIPRISPEQHVEFFKEKLALVEAHQDFFIRHQKLAWINVDADCARAILNDAGLARRISRLPFIELAINENFPEINQGQENGLLKNLAQRHSLVLSNFGAGIATTRPVVEGLFRRVMLDRNFVLRLIDGPSFEPFMQAIVSQLAGYCTSLAIAGIDTDASRQRAHALGFAAMQGLLWPPVEPDDIASLIP